MAAHPTIQPLCLLPIAREGSVPLPPAALTEIAREALGATRELYSAAGFTLPWISYLAVDGGEVVGICGFTSPPVAGAVEIAYFTFPGFEGRGVATAMATGLYTMAAAADTGVAVTAHTLPTRNASHRVLEKANFVQARHIDHPVDGRILVWVLASGKDAGPSPAT